MTESVVSELADRKAREDALDTSRSILVQAPAGSGKTELLAMRFLKLLAEVEEPEQVLAITFGRAATTEIAHRIVGKLEKARTFLESGVAPEGEDKSSLQIVTAAYTNSIERGWRLLERPQRFKIATIDSLCLSIAHHMPLSVNPGGMLRPEEDAAPLYQKAARKTLDRLGAGDGELNAALEALLRLRDSRLANCEELIADMLATRDQWTRAFPLTGDIDWQQARARLEEPFQREIHRVLGEAHSLLSSHPALTAELLELANYACNGVGLKVDIRLLAGLTELPLPSPEFFDHWRCFCDFLLTKEDEVRKGFNVNNGFPSGDDGQKRRMEALASSLSNIPGLGSLLGEIRALPPPNFTEKQWLSLRHIFVVLRHTVIELSAVFADQGVVDFVEIGMAALRVLRGEGAGGQPIQHLLVDEFQDTSRTQHELIAALLRGWSADVRTEKGRTLFVVGDPMQSIYMFRQADVELFDLVRRHGFAAGDEHLPLNNLQLATNFRSKAGVVNPLNEMFEIVFPHNAKAGAAVVQFLSGVSRNLGGSEGIVEVHANFAAAKNEDSRDYPTPGTNRAPEAPAREQETAEVLSIIQHHLPRIDSANQQGKEFTVAVLARAKNHLVPIAAALREAGIPFRAIDLETLSERQEILDLQSLVRALQHPMDRIAWLALLRAPWCGLELRDLHLLCGTDEDQFGGGAVSRQIEERLHLLDEEPRERVKRVCSILRGAAENRHRQSSFSAWIERTWRSLGGAACVDATGYENAREYFRMLDQLSPDGIDATGEAMQRQLATLFARPDPGVSERCGIQLMTMHKAKGLGFNVVLLPGLHRVTRSYALTLIRYLERATEVGTELLVAPIDDAGEETSPLNRWVRLQKENREAEERKRLLYVACTRARDELHLFATGTVTNSGLSYKPSSLLGTAWPALENYFEEQYEQTISVRHTAAILDFPSVPAQTVTGVLNTVAAVAAPTMLRRLPLTWSSGPVEPNILWRGATAINVSVEHEEESKRPQGSRSSRILGTSIHALFERAARLFKQGASETDFRAALPGLRAQAVALARNAGLPPAEIESMARKAVGALEAALSDPQGLWILKPHSDAQIESSWTGLMDGIPQQRRMDRIFRAGPEPRSGGEDFLWVIDYKSSDRSAASLVNFLANEQLMYARQLQGYARMLRLAHGENLQLRLALYYPLIGKLLVASPTQSAAGVDEAWAWRTW